MGVRIDISCNDHNITVFFITALNGRNKKDISGDCMVIHTEDISKKPALPFAAKKMLPTEVESIL